MDKRKMHVVHTYVHVDVSKWTRNIQSVSILALSEGLVTTNHSNNSRNSHTNSCDDVDGGLGTLHNYLIRKKWIRAAHSIPQPNLFCISSGSKLFYTLTFSIMSIFPFLLKYVHE